MAPRESWNATVLVGQSGGPTAAINATLAGVFECAHQLGARVLGMRNGIEGVLAGRVVDLDGLLSDPLQLDLLRRTPASLLGSCRYKLPDPDGDAAPFERLFARFEALGVDAVLYIGGNDSMDTIEKLARYGERAGSPIRFMGVPKTIDNDMVGTDHTPGYGSAAKFVACAVKEVARDSAAYFLKSVTVVEIMGRDAGWLTAASTLAGRPGAGGPDLILLPEAPLDVDAFVGAVERLLEERDTVVVAASEGVVRADGEPLFRDESVGMDAFGHVATQSGVGRYLAALLKGRLGVKTRAVEFSTLQRCASHLASATDLEEASTLGGVAVQAAKDGCTGMVPVMSREHNRPYSVSYGLSAISAVANRVRRVPAEWIRPDGMGVTDEMREYARPLIQGEAAPTFVEGLPWHLWLPGEDA